MNGKAKAFIVVYVTIVLIVCSASILRFTQIRCSQIESPDGRYYAVGRMYLYECLMSKLRGQTNEGSGTVTIYTRSGRRIGPPVELPAVRIIEDIKWDRNVVIIPSVAEWKLPG